MRKTTKLVVSLATVTLFGTSLVACSASPEENSASACTAYAEFIGAVAGVKTSLTSSATIGEIKDARDKVSSAYKDLNSSLDQVSSDRADALASAWKDLDSAVSGLDDGLTVSEAKDSLADDISKVESAQKELDADLQC